MSPSPARAAAADHPAAISHGATGVTVGTAGPGYSDPNIGQRPTRPCAGGFPGFITPTEGDQHRPRVRARIPNLLA